MGLLEQAKADIEQITSSTDDWAAVITFTSPNQVKATINGLHTKHQLGYDPETGKPTISKKATIGFSERLLTVQGYPVRDVNGNVSLKKHRVSVADSTGNVMEYVITEPFADETIGFISCILGDFKI